MIHKENLTDENYYTDLENWVNLGAGGALDGVINMTDPFILLELMDIQECYLQV